MIYNNSNIYVEDIDIAKAGYSLNEQVKKLIEIAAYAHDAICAIHLQTKDSFYGDGYVLFLEFERKLSPDQINDIIDNVSNTANSAGIEVYVDIAGSPSFEEVKKEVVCVWQN